MGQVGNPMPLTLRCEALADLGLIMVAPSNLALPGKRAAARPDGSGIARPMTGLGKFALGDAAKHALQLQIMFLFRTSLPEIGQARIDHVLRPGKTDLPRIQIGRLGGGIDRCPDEVVGRHTQDQLFFRHVRRGGTERM